MELQSKHFHVLANSGITNKVKFKILEEQGRLSKVKIIIEIVQYHNLSKYT